MRLMTIAGKTTAVKSTNAATGHDPVACREATVLSSVATVRFPPASIETIGKALAIT